MMVVELVAGVVYGSMALLADGLHMGSHAVALSITAFAYIYARRNAHNSDFSFGTGKVNALGGFTGAILLALFALFMAVESIMRLVYPVEIIFNQAILVAVIGLLVNGASVFILGVHDHHHDDHSHGHDHHVHDHAHDHHGHEHHVHAHEHHHQHDHNLKSAYLHVMADALTSVLAIIALLAGKYFGLVWMDPVMGIIGAILVASWSYGLMRSTSSVLLDRQAPDRIRRQVHDVIEADDDSRITDLHVWSIGPGIYSAQIALVAHDPLSPAEYKAMIPDSLGLVHVAVEVHVCPDNTES